jgi:hypothetical protein
MHIEKKEIEGMLHNALLMHTNLFDYVYDGKVDTGFNAIPKAEQVAIIGLLNDTAHLKDSLSNYLHWFDDTDE